MKMKKIALVFGMALAFSATARAADIAVSTQAGWFGQAAADRESQEIATKVKGAAVELFTATQHAALAEWVVDHTGDGVSDLLILCGQLPDTLYTPGNAQPDGSLIELFLDDGNCIINTGDWIFYVVNGAGTNGTAALPNVMDIPSMDMWDDDTPVTVTADGQKYTPSLVNFSTDRAIHISSLTGDWYAELILALAADGNRADPVILRNSGTGGRIGIFFQTAGQDNDPRGEVISEWINNWYLPMVTPAKTATNPLPVDGAGEVLRDAILSWKPGVDAATHDVYLGTTFADVDGAAAADPRGVLVSQGQTDAEYDSDVLFEYGQTYYWRVDEVNAAPDYTLFKGDVWSFTVEPYAYPITSLTATASSSQPGMGPENTINRSGLNANDQHSTDPATMWTAAGAMPAWIQYEFDQVYKVHELLVWNSNQPIETFLGMGAKTVTIEYSTDGVTWATLEGVPEFARATATATYAANTTVAFNGVMARFVKLTITANWGGMAPQSGLSEVRFSYVPLQAFEPEPAAGAANIAVATELDWRPGREATSHKVYLGTDSAAVAAGDVAAATVTDHGYTPASLNYATTYYWKVDEVGDVGTYAGNVWSFTTEAFAVVDDFESYNNKDNRIYQTWVDGLTDDASGSQVGYDESPFAELTVIHGGRQAMPFIYSNTSFAFSQATRTFQDAQNWTARGIKSLAIHFAGVSGNGGALYVKINNAKIVYDGDQADLAKSGWQAWNIDLSAVSGASSVRSLTIGVEGSGAAGKLYIDDIRLYPKAPEYIVPVQPAATNLVGYYTLDEGSGAKAGDTSGKGYHGTLKGTPEWVAGKIGGALAFGGDGDFVDLANPADWPAGAEPRSMCAWLKTQDLTATWHFAVAYGSANTNQAMFIGLNGTGLYGGGYGNDVSKTNFWEIDVWHHVALTYDGTTARLYADGVEVASAAKAWNLVRSRARIGQQINDLNEFWVGSVDDVRIYNKALSPEEAAGLAGQTKPRHKPF
jgi:hypothetical protein